MMKTALLAIFGLAAVALGVLYAQERAEVGSLGARVVALEAQLARKSVDLQKQSAAAVALANDKTKLAARVESARKRLAEARASAVAVAAVPEPAAPVPPEESPAPAAAGAAGAAVEKASGPLGEYLDKMMQDPAMKKMMRSQQAMALHQMYGDLVKQWALSPDDANHFYDLLLDRQMAAMENLGKGSKDRMAATTEGDEALEASLGEEMYGQYQAYEKTMADRMALNQFKQRLDADSAPALTPDQTQFLMKAMADERVSGFSNPTSLARLGQTGGMSQEEIDGYMKAQAAVDEKVAMRAAGLLTPAQMTSFKQYQTQMREMQKLGFDMAAKITAKP